MGYLTQFKNDLFVSYRRAANGTHDRWVDVFCEALRNSLVELVGNVTMWRDADELTAGEAWRAELQTALDEAAIFLAIFSRSYFQSDECRKELDRFLLRMQDKTGAPRRIVPVFKQPPNPDAIPPPQVTALQRHDFFYWSPPGSPHWIELAPNAGDAEGRDFWESLGRLAQDIMIALEELQGDARRRARGKVFVARVAPELEQQRERVRADLQLRGYLVVPRNEYIWNGSPREEIAADLDGALLCVHLVTGERSSDPDSASHSRLQLVLAHEAMKARNRPAPLVWIQGSARVDPSAQELIETIESDLANEGLEYWRGSFENLKTQIYDKLPAPAPEQPAPAVDDVALLVEEGDLAGVGGLRASLVDGVGVEPKPVKFTGSAPKDADRMRRTLAGCRRCVIFWGAQPEEWIDDLLALPELAPCAGPATLCICIAAPATVEKSVFRSRKATVVDIAAGPADAALHAFFGVSAP